MLCDLGQAHDLPEPLLPLTVMKLAIALYLLIRPLQRFREIQELNPLVVESGVRARPLEAPIQLNHSPTRLLDTRKPQCSHP